MGSPYHQSALICIVWSLEDTGTTTQCVAHGGVVWGEGGCFALPALPQVWAGETKLKPFSHVFPSRRTRHASPIAMC